MNNDTNDVINEEVLDITPTTNSITSETKKDKKKKKVKKVKPSNPDSFANSFKDIFRLGFKTIRYTWKLLNSSNVDIRDSKLAKEIKVVNDKLGITQKKITRLEKDRRKLQLELQGDVKENKTPKTYIYKVKDKKGRFITGKFSALSKSEVNSFLLNEGYEVYKIENNKTIDFVYG